MDRKQIADLREKVVNLLRAAETDSDAKPLAARELAHFVLVVTHAEAKVLGFSNQEAKEGANRVFERLQTYIPARGIKDPEHIVNLAEHFIRGGYVRDKSGKPIRNKSGKLKWRPGVFDIMKREGESAQRRTVSLQESIPYMEADSEGGQTTFEDVTPNPANTPQEELIDAKRPVGQAINHWVEELAREAEAEEDQVKRETLNALILHIKHLVAHCNGIRSSAGLYITIG